LKREQDWRAALDELSPPPAVLEWAASQSGDFQQAWAACSDPMARLWLARAGGASQKEIVAAIGELIARASAQAKLAPDATEKIAAARLVLQRFVQGKATDDERALAADDLGGARFGWAGNAMDLAFATEHALRAAKDVSTMDVPHDFMWLMDANGALKTLVSGFKTKGLIPSKDAGELLRASIHPTGVAVAATAPLSLAEMKTLTDAQLVGRVFVQAIAKGDRASADERVIGSTITLEDEVLNGGFGQFFSNWSDAVGADAEDGYRRIGRKDLAALVSEARTKAKGAKTFGDLDMRFWKALEKSPTADRAAYLRQRASSF
jgi:hypothetical protein